MITTIYALFEYLLYASEKEIHDTYYIFEWWIPDSITSHFEHKYKLPKFKKQYQWNHRYCWAWVRYFKWRYLPNFNDYNLIAHDHLSYSTIFIGKRNYTMLEDGPLIFSQKGVDLWTNKFAYRRHLKFQRLRRFLLGSTYGYPMGTNPQCTDLIVTSMDIAKELKNKNIHYFDIFNEWKTSSEQKRGFILDVFGITQQLLKQIKDRDIVYFPNAFCEDRVFTEDEYRDFYKRLLKKYDMDRLIIKPHPRDYCKFYQVDLPGVVVIPSFIPSQLLDLIGLRFKKAITICSSSVLNLGYPIEIDWYGKKCHPNIINRYGEDEIVPEGVNICTLEE